MKVSAHPARFACSLRAAFLLIRCAQMSPLRLLQDYYRRHICGAMLHERQARTALATVDPPLAEPADLTTTLQRLIDGEGSSAQAQALPLLVQRGSDAVPRSKHLLSVFRALSHSLDACVQLVRRPGRHVHACLAALGGPFITSGMARYFALHRG